MLRMMLRIVLTCLLAAFLGSAATAAPPIAAPTAFPGGADIKAARAVIEAVKKPDYDAAWAAVEKVKSDPVRKALRWYLLVDPKSGASFADLTGFALDNPDWPGIANLRRNADKALREDTPAAEITAWFKRFGPVSAKGWQVYARALKQTGAGATVAPLVQATWRGTRMSLVDQLAFLQAFGAMLRPDDHTARLRFLLAQRRGRWIVARMLPVLPVPETDKSLLRLRLKLQSRIAATSIIEVTEALSRVTNAQRRREGFLLDEIRWLRRQGRLEEAAALLSHTPDTPKFTRRWLVARTALAYALLQEKKPAPAYAAVAGHRQPAGYGKARSEFVAGWIALRWLQKPAVARTHFQTIYTSSRFSISKARGAYWVARAEAAAGKPKAHTAWMRTTAAYTLTFYGQLAAARLGLRRLVLPAHRPVTAAARKAIDAEPLAVAARLFAHLGERGAARAFLWRLLNSAKDAPRMAAVADFAHRIRHRPVGVRAARRALMRLHPAIRPGYPTLPFARHTRVERALIHAIIRQESEFDARAISRSNARGLMQLLPSTARQVARNLRLRYSYARLTEDPAFNVKLGSGYLDYLLKRFRGSYVLTIASYNAGPNRVQQWITTNGDPREKSVDLLDWMELIPVGETRNYVQRVLENLAVYRALSRRAAVGGDMRRLWQSRAYR
jgi:soluble lytic murein transglycosylase